MSLEDALEAIVAQDKQIKSLESKLSTLLKASEGMEKALERIVTYFEAMVGENEIPKNYVYDKAKQALADFRAVKERL